MSFVPQPSQSEPLISYDEALSRIKGVAESVYRDRDTLADVSKQEHSSRMADATCEDGASVPLTEAVGHRSYHTLYAPHSTPRYDTSAMDGFAVNAISTENASRDAPVRLRITHSIAAGEDLLRRNFEALDCSVPPRVCAEIMTGACFPEYMPHLDSVVKVEDVSIEDDWSEDRRVMSRSVLLQRPVKPFQHRRPAGSDLKQGEMIIKQGTIVEPRHVAALASLGYSDIRIMAATLRPRPCGMPTVLQHTLRVGILSTGTEIVRKHDITGNPHQTCKPSQQAVYDSNGPYLISCLRKACPWVEIEYLGIVEDDVERLTDRFRTAIFGGEFDVIVTSGGVSKGRHDLVRHVIEERLGGHIVFHGVKIRPGAPVLLASFSQPEGPAPRATRRRVVVFGAPGNPLAAAVTLRFFIVPFVMELDMRKPQERSKSLNRKIPNRCDHLMSFEQEQEQEPEKKSCVWVRSTRQKPNDMTIFWLARHIEAGEGSVEIVDDQASYKLKGLLEADSWVVIPAGLNQVSCGEQHMSSPL